MTNCSSKIAQKFQIENERITHLHGRELQHTRINLSKAHDVEKSRLEKIFKDQISTLTKKHSQEMKLKFLGGVSPQSVQVATLHFQTIKI